MSKKFKELGTNDYVFAVFNCHIYINRIHSIEHDKIEGSRTFPIVFHFDSNSWACQFFCPQWRLHSVSTINMTHSMFFTTDLSLALQYCLRHHMRISKVYFDGKYNPVDTSTLDLIRNYLNNLNENI